jgi:hypothetical protein
VLQTICELYPQLTTFSELEAMWIDFECNAQQDYMVKIYIGGVNAISGEPAIEDADTNLRR